VDGQTLSNLGLYSAQLACVVALGGLTFGVLRVDTAAVRYVSWRALLTLTLTLPWLQRRRVRLEPASVDADVFFSTIAGSDTVGGVSPAAIHAFNWPAAITLVLAFGIAVRLGWLTIGFLRLGRLRRAGAAAHDAEEYEELQRLIGARAELRYVENLGQPVTFGARRPVILLPGALHHHEPPIRRAILSHELLHVKRRDWIWTLLEEVTCALLWFHPAVWWLVDRVQLAREEVVDELTVRATGGRRRVYLEALMSFAGGTPIASAPALGTRRHLFRRMVLLSKEGVMSSKRVVLSAAAAALVVLAGSWYIVEALPLTYVALEPAPVPRESAALQQGSGGAVAPASEAGPLERSARPITPENPIPRRTSGIMPLSPTGVVPEVRVFVALRLSIDQTGRVAEVRPLRRGPAGVTGPSGTATGTAASPQAPLASMPAEQFVQAAIGAVRQWTYEPPLSAPIVVDVLMAFDPRAREAQLLSHGPTAPLAAAVTRGVARGGGGATGGVRAAAAPPAAAAVPSPPPSGRADSAPQDTDPLVCPGAIRVGNGIAAPTRVTNIRPEYSPEALAAKVEGIVVLDACIGADGRVDDARVSRSVPLLDQSALDAIWQWEFTPTLLNGEPVPVVITFTVNFTLK
jgi:TonB family protein